MEDTSIEDEIDTLIEDSLRAKDIGGTWNFNEYKKYTLNKAIPSAQIISLMSRAIDKE